MSNLQIISIWWKVNWWSVFYFFCCWRPEWLSFAHLNAHIKYVQRKECILQGETVPGRAGEGTASHREESCSAALPALEFNVTAQFDYRSDDDYGFYLWTGCNNEQTWNLLPAIWAFLSWDPWTRPPHGKIAQCLYGCTKFSGCSCAIRQTGVILF